MRKLWRLVLYVAVDHCSPSRAAFRMGRKAIRAFERGLRKGARLW